MGGQKFCQKTTFTVGHLSQQFHRIFAQRYAFASERRRQVEAYNERLPASLEALSAQVMDGSYQPDYLGTIICQAKADGSVKRRGIVLCSVQDLIVQRCLLGPFTELILNPRATPQSFGRNKNPHESRRDPITCARAIGKERRDRPYAYETDLINFFPSINGDDVKKEIVESCSSIEGGDDLAHLLSTIITPSVRFTDKVEAEEQAVYWPNNGGVHQGTVLAPAIANFFLFKFDSCLPDKWRLFRYIDDLVVLTESHAEGEEAARFVEQNLPHGINCHALGTKKSSVIHDDQKIPFVGLDITTEGKVRPRFESITKFETHVEEICAASTDLISLVAAIRRYSSAWFAYYGQTDLGANHRNQITRSTRKAVKDWMSQKGLHTEDAVRLLRLLEPLTLCHADKKYKEQVRDIATAELLLGETMTDDIDELLARIRS